MNGTHHWDPLPSIVPPAPPGVPTIVMFVQLYADKKDRPSNHFFPALRMPPGLITNLKLLGNRSGWDRHVRFDGISKNPVESMFACKAAVSSLMPSQSGAAGTTGWTCARNHRTGMIIIKFWRDKRLWNPFPTVKTPQECSFNPKGDCNSVDTQWEQSRVYETG